MECPKCKSSNTEEVKSFGTKLYTRSEGMQARAIDNFNRTVLHRHAGLLGLAFMAASCTAKYVLSTVHKCKSCGNEWRKWF
jgi:hypothetical protein